MAQAQNTRVQVDSTVVSFSQSNFETGWCFQAGNKLAPPHRGEANRSAAAAAAAEAAAAAAEAAAAAAAAAAPAATAAAAAAAAAPAAVPPVCAQVVPQTPKASCLCYTSPVRWCSPQNRR